jgi:hypothetical protein
VRRFLSALAFCICLLIAISFVLFPPVRAKEDPIAALLDLPAPPPPNPLVSPYRARDKDFYNKFKPPKDDAPIDEILEYWRTRSDSYNQLGGEVTPSAKTLERIMREIERDHKLLSQYMNILPDGDTSERFVRGLIDSEGESGVYDKEARDAIRSWMFYHTAAYSDELRQAAEQVRDQDEYLTDQTELLALTRVDFAKAEPILNKLYNDSTQKTSQTLAKWALYRHAIDTNSLDIDKYRDELKAVVEDKGATPGMRDLALDALSKEKDWPGRDEWYLSLLSDETLSDLRVNGASYTGLTTMMYYVPDDRLTDKMLEMLKSDNKTVRANVIRNLLLKLETGGIELVRAMVPWLEDPKWADDNANSRYTLVSKLADYEIPESVPGLIKTLDEKRLTSASNTMSNSAVSNSSYGYSVANRAAANAIATMANSASPRANANATAYATTYDSETDDYSRYPLRDISIAALAKQKDPRAVPALKRVLSDVQYYQQTTVVRALIECKGFTIAEQLDGLELAAKSARAEMDGTPAADPLANLYRYSNTNAGNANSFYAVKRAPSAFELKAMVGRELMNAAEIPDDLARAVVDRIAALDKSDKPLAEAMRRIAMKWQSPVLDLLLLSDLKNGRTDSESILKLLTRRKAIREKQSTDIFYIRTGSQAALGISSCLMEDQNDAATLLENAGTEAKTALLACSRLIRLPLPIDKVAANLTSETPLLAAAAERYLESEDSPAARNIVLSRHPGEARLMGATSAFFVSGAGETSSEMLSNLYASLGDNSLYNGWYGSGNDEDIRLFEKAVQDEVKKTADMIGMYAYDGNYIRIYKDKVVYSFDEDSSRYRERPLEKHEFDEIKAYIHDNKLDELPPFLSCGGEYCEAKELLMLGKNGGRRVYVNGDSAGVFDGLAKIFDGMKKAPATLRYSLSRDLKGLEILIASDDLHAETVWKDATGLKIAASQTAVRKKIEDEAAKITEEVDPSEGPESIEKRKQEMRNKHAYDGYGWYRVTPSGAEPGAAQPAGLDIIPARDALAVQPGIERWMRSAAGLEIRASQDGLFKVIRGRMTKVRPGTYDSPIVTPNGRWVVVAKGDPDETGQSLVVLDLVTNKERTVEIPDNVGMVPSAYVSSINKVLVKPSQYYADAEYYETVPDDAVPDDPYPESMMLVDPATGAVQPIAGEFRPLGQQTFRPLQTTGRSNEFWAAIYDLEKNVTEVGYYETKTFGFRPVLRVPKIKFNSMSMYVDEPANKVYFVYRGHLLALPLTPKPEPAALPSPR